MNLLMEEIQEFLEPKLRNSYTILDEVSRPRGYTDNFITGAKVGFKMQLEKIGCSLEDCGVTGLGSLVLMFSKDNQNYAAVVGKSESTGEVKFQLTKRNQNWEIE